MGKIKKIIEAELVGGTQVSDVYPVTSTKAVYNEYSERLDNILGNLNDKIGFLKNAGYLYAGIATTITDPGIPKAKVFYIANSKGIYDNFGDIEVTEDEVVFLYWDSSWHKVSTGIASQKNLIELNEKVDSLALGAFYGYFPDSSSLPIDITTLGYAYVGSDNHYEIWNFNGESWSDSGTSINMNDTDEEDITRNVDGKLQFKDRPYENGMGYIILRKNKTFEELVIQTNTIYEIRYDFNLNNKEITIPENCILFFKGGNIKNGILNLNNTYLDGFVSISCDIIGSVSNTDIYVKWFNPYADGITDDSRIIRKAYMLANKNGAKLIFDNKIYMYGDGLLGDDGTGNSYTLDPIYDRQPLQDNDHPADIGRDIRMIFVNKDSISIIGNGATLLAHPNNGECKHNEFLLLYRCTNVLVENLHIEGNKTARQPRLNDYNSGNEIWDLEGNLLSNTKKYGYAQRSNIEICYGQNIILRNVISNESIMDGIVIAGDKEEIPKNIQVINCTCNFCYRMGLTLSSVNDCTVDGGSYSFSGYALDKVTKLGTPPMAGIDVEADSFQSYNIEIKNTTIERNVYNGIVLSRNGRNITVHHNYIIGDSISATEAGGYNNEIAYNYFYNGGIYIHQSYLNIHHNIFQTDKDGGKNHLVISINCTDIESPTTFANNIVKVLPDGIDSKELLYYSAVNILGNVYVKDNTFTNVYHPKNNALTVKALSFTNNTIINQKEEYSFLNSIFSVMLYSSTNTKSFLNNNFSNNKLVGDTGRAYNEYIGNNITHSVNCGTAAITIQRSNSKVLIYKLPRLPLHIDVVDDYKYTIHVDYVDGYYYSNLYYTHDNLTPRYIVPTEDLCFNAYLKNNYVYLKIKPGFLLPNRYFCTIVYDTNTLPLSVAYYPEEVEETELSGATIMYDLSKSQSVLPKLTHNFKGTCIVNEEDNTPYWLSADNKWVNSKGIEYGVNNKGTFAEKPSTAKIPIGYSYYCIDRQTIEGASNGIVIYYKGDDIWTDALGRVVS